MSDGVGYFTYMLECADGTLYTGWSTDPAQRLIAHNSGKGAKYTRTRLPVTLAAVWEFGSKAEAMRFEWELKRMTRPQKLQQILHAKNPAASGQSGFAMQ